MKQKVEQQWMAEAKRRRDEIRSGRVKPIPAEEVYRRIDCLLGKSGYTRVTPNGVISPS